MALSTFSFTYAGTNVFYTPFALGVLSEAHITAYVVGELDGLGGQIYRTFTYNETTSEITIDDSGIATGATVVVDRTVPKTELTVRFADTDDVSKRNLDRQTMQALMAAHEVLDGRIANINTIIDQTTANVLLAQAAQAAAEAAAADAETAVVAAELAEDGADDAQAAALAAQTAAEAASASATAAQAAAEAALAETILEAAAASDQVGKYWTRGYQVGGLFRDGPATAGSPPKGFAELSTMDIVDVAADGGTVLSGAKYAARCTSGTGIRRLVSHQLDCRANDVIIPRMYVRVQDYTSGTITFNCYVWFVDTTGTLITPATVVHAVNFTAASGWVDVRANSTGPGYVVAPAGTMACVIGYARTGTGTGKTYLAALMADRLTKPEIDRGFGLSPKDFGCVGDGVTNDTVNLQKAATAALAIKCPLFFSPEDFYLFDHVNFGDKCRLTGRAQIKSSGFDVRANLPTQRYLARVGKHGDFDVIEYQGTYQYGYTSDTSSADFDTGLAGQLFVDDFVRGNCIEITDDVADGSSRVMLTGHHQNIGFVRSSHYRDGSNVLQPRDSVHNCRRPLIISGEWSQNGSRRPGDPTDLDDYLPSYVFASPAAIAAYEGAGHTVWDDNFGDGLFLGGYDMRFYQRGVSCSYVRNFHIGPGILTGRAQQAEISNGNNGWLIFCAEDGKFVSQTVEDSAEHAIRLASDDRVGCKRLQWHGLKVARQGPSAFKLNGGGGANYSATIVTGNTAANLVRSRDISIFGMDCVDPFIRPATGDGKSLHLVRVSHCDGFYLHGLSVWKTDQFYGSGDIDPWTDLAYPAEIAGTVLAFSNSQRVYIDTVSFPGNSAKAMLKIAFLASNDFESGDATRDFRHYHISVFNMEHDAATSGEPAPIKSDGSTGFATTAGLGDIEIVDTTWTTSCDIWTYSNFAATTQGRIWITGVVQDGTTLNHSDAAANNTSVSFLMSASSTLVTGRAIDLF